MSGLKLGILGGTFNPIHIGHLRAAEEVKESLGLNKVVFVPAARPPHKSLDIAPAQHRMEMVRLAIRDNPGFEASDFELTRPEPSFSVHTLDHFSRTLEGARLYFLIGLDAFLDISSWLEPERIMALAAPVILLRPPRVFDEISGFPYIEMPARKDLDALNAGNRTVLTVKSRGGGEVILHRITSLDISATAIRDRLRAGKTVKYLLPEAVESYILFNKLYPRTTGGIRS